MSGRTLTIEWVESPTTRRTDSLDAEAFARVLDQKRGKWARMECRLDSNAHACVKWLRRHGYEATQRSEWVYARARAA